MARKKNLSWPLNLKWRDLNKNLPPVMWHDVVGADDNSFLVVATSRQKMSLEQISLYKQGLSVPREQEMEIATAPSAQNDDECTFQQKKRMKSRT